MWYYHLMNNLHIRRFLLAGFLCLTTTLISVQSVEAAYLYLEPSSKTVEAGDVFDVALKINTEGEKPTTADTILLYDSGKLDFLGIDDPTDDAKFFPNVFDRTITDKLYVGAAIKLGSQPVAGDGTITILKFKGKQAGTVTVTFDCSEGSTRDSNISLKVNNRVTDVIDCGKVVNGTYLISSGGMVPTSYPTPSGATLYPTYTPTPTPRGSGGDRVVTLTPSPTSSSTPSATFTPTNAPVTASPSALPKSGVLDTTGTVILAGVAFVIISLIVKAVLL